MPAAFIRIFSYLWNSRWGLPVSIFILVTVIPGALRMDIPYLWNDTPEIMRIEAVLAKHSGVSPYNAFLEFLRGVFYDFGIKQYRPLNLIVVVAQVLFFKDYPFIPIFTSSAMLGATAVFIYFLALELTQKKVLSLTSSLLYSFSVPSIAMTWNVFNKQPLVSLLIVLGMWFYMKYRKDNNRILWLYSFWAVCLLGSLFRELVGLLPFTVLLTELAEKRREKRLLISLCILLLQFAFPSFLINLFFYKHPVVITNLLRENLRDRMLFDFEMPYRLLLLLSPVIIVLCLASIALYVFDKKKPYSLIVSAAILSGIAGMFVHMPAISHPISMESLLKNPAVIFLPVPALLCAVISVASFRFGKLLPIWFAVSWVPFIVVGQLEVHLAPALMPLTIIAALWAFSLAETLKRRKRIVPRHVAVAAIYFFISIGCLDQSLNIAGAYNTFSGISKGVMEMAGWLKKNAQPGAVIVTNFEHGLDVSYFARNGIENYSTISVSYPFSRHVVATTSDFYEMLKANYGKREVYLIAQTPGIHRYTEELKDLLEFKSHFVIKARYPFTDPLRNISPRASFAGPADLKDNFILTTNLFCRDWSAAYDLYKLR